MAWEYETFGPDGQCKLFGVNIFDYNWQTTGKRVKVKDPIYHQEHTFEVWQVEIDGGVPCGHNRDNTWRGWTLPGTAHHILRIASILWDW